MSDERTETVTRSKVARVIGTYDLGDVGADLERKWTRDDDRYSLRDLADEFNRKVLAAALDSAGQRASQYDVAHAYSVLTGDDVTEGARVQKRRELEREGVDVEVVDSDFVTHQAMHTYLRDVRGATLEREGRDPVESGAETLERLRGRTAAVTRETVERLRDRGDVDAGDLDVYVEIRIHCEACGTEMDVAEFLEAEGCECGGG
ncbi:Uncharacterized protein HSRCO_0462 [Halanaeroarchaeum sp. HSR-CO]|uniref:rod-determining factor RdfA n=1 Tax=Halanaeroarchaeum sp. HSR-CO TaxID=2866382 RepID=UPI00217CD38D|nr:rod-determining factor RdfA [Halanaeroarchaeum sp. HSR-CO]UWG46759.1 Uncharacterized protein HSRCO_0462 [Halanaeroarchaeum sp. HSR-CO]